MDKFTLMIQQEGVKLIILGLHYNVKHSVMILEKGKINLKPSAVYTML